MPATGPQTTGKETSKGAHLGATTLHATLRLWWYTGSLEAVIGLWLIAEALALAALGGHGLGIPCIVALVILCALIPLTFTTLHRNLIVPSGVVVEAGSRNRATALQIIIGAAVFVAAFCLAAFRYSDPVLAVGVLVAALPLVGWMASDMPRYVVLALITVIAFALASLALGRGMFTPTRCIAIGLLITGVAALVMGVVRSRVVTRLVVDKVASRGDFDGEGRRISPDMLFCQEQYRAAFESRQWYVRYLTCEYLCNAPDPDSLPFIIEAAAHDEDRRVRDMAGSAICSAWGPDVESLMYLRVRELVVTDRDFNARSLTDMERVRLHAVKDMESFELRVEKSLQAAAQNDPEFLSALMELATTEQGQDEDVRKSAIELLGPTHSVAAYQTLSSLLSDEGREMGYVAVGAYRGASSEAVPGIVTHFSDTRGWVRVLSLNAAMVLLDGLRERDPGDCLRARNALQDPIRKMLASPNTVTQSAALGVYAFWGKEAVPYIESFLHDRHALVRGQALCALAFADPEAAKPCIGEALDDMHSFVRNCAIGCAITAHDTSYVEKVRALLASGDRGIAERAQYYLAYSDIWKSAR